MLLKQSRIRNTSKLNFIKENSIIRVGVSNIDRFTDILQEIGFSSNLVIGQTILPGVIGPITKKNSNGDIILHKDQEKETHYRMIEWTYKQWAGKGQTIDVTDSTEVPYKRYPRTIIPAYSTELTVVNSNNGLSIVSPEIPFNKDNEELIVHVVNLFLEIFGECQVLDTDSNLILAPEVIKLNWEVLPQGNFPWEVRKSQIYPFIDKARGSNKKIIKHRLEAINKHNPDFIAIGRAGFNGYLIYGFVNKNIYILESIYINNATYILEDNWESISKLTKAEILNENLHKCRVIHSKNWYERINSLLNDLFAS